METNHPDVRLWSGEGKNRARRAMAEIFQPRFSPEEEAAFRDHKARKVILIRRCAAVLAPMFWMIFMYWDIKHHGHYEALAWILGIRLLGGILLSVMTLLTFQQSFYRETFAERTLIVAVTGAWIGVIAMSLLSPAPGSYLDYHPGLTLILFFLFSVLWIDAKRATELGILLFLVYCASLWWCWEALPDGEIGPGRTYEQDFTYHTQVTAFYLSSFVLLGSLVGYQLEGYLRREFIQQGKLQAQKQRTEQLNYDLQDRILDIEKMNVERQHQTETLIQLKEEQRRLAIEGSRKKSTFLASAAHDLRQPLTALQAIVEALEQSLSQGDLEAAKAHMVLTRRSSRAMRSTLNAVLEISRLESGIVEPEYSDFDLRKLLQEICSQYATSAMSKGLDFRLHPPLPASGGPVLVRSDSVLLARLVSNLISNAIKYTPSRPDQRSGVVVGLVRFGARVRVDVYDTGIGIAKADRAAIFEPFYQIGNRERDREKGLGLGLSIVRQIVDLLEQHRLEFKSVPGRGSRFSLDIPVSTLESIDTPAPDPTSDETPPPENLRGIYILLVEDDGLVRSTVQAMLESWGCLVEASADLEAVCEFVKRAERIPDVVLTDFHLPDGKSAHDVIEVVQTEFRRPMPVVVMSGEVAALGNLRKSVSDVVPKPPDHRALRQAIAACLPEKER